MEVIFKSSYGLFGSERVPSFVQYSQNQRICRQLARLGRVKITSRACSDLKISHRILHYLNRGKLNADCAKFDPVGFTVF